MHVSGGDETQERQNFMSAWGRHTCGASWMTTGLPQEMGSGVGVTAWLHRPDTLELHFSRLSIQPDGTLVPNVSDKGREEFSRLQNALAVHCIRCGSCWQYLVLAPTTDSNKFVVQLRCPTCHFLVVGSLVREGVWVHLAVFSGADVDSNA